MDTSAHGLETDAQAHANIQRHYNNKDVGYQVIDKGGPMPNEKQYNESTSGGRSAAERMKQVHLANMAEKAPDNQIPQEKGGQ
ncbi:hypothetical protein HK097_000251 [Rhizophlyctis rosea]|uniref:Uncharacterized protein n=1 Tax=Rhizophlyctis rosea TaxID=64517 RepID=A0AAD5X733_9FUNG|nr:hypothetical protein HK097_000251 [Rhizophlyctis rosea]